MVDKQQIMYLYHLQGVKELFDEYAESFDDHLLNGLRYDVPNLLRKQIPADHFERCLDLGCGTGLSGIAFRECCDYLEGVDISRKMTDKAVARGVYDEAKHSDLQGHLKRCKGASFDLIISVDVVMYVYDLAPLFKEVKRVLSLDGTFALSTEALHEDEASGVEMLERESCRYAHSRKYVQRLAEDGFELQSVVNVLGRMDEGKEIRSDIFVFRRTA
jgi:predicted TPR repeat methyltransferase